MITSGLANEEFPVPRGQKYAEVKSDGITVVAVAAGYNNPNVGTAMSGWRRMLKFYHFSRLAAQVGRTLPKPDVVFATHTPLPIGLAGACLARHFNVPFVFEVRDLWPDALINLGGLKNPLVIWHLRRMAKKIYAQAEHIVALSPGIKDGIVRAGVAEERVTVITNACDCDLFRPDLDGSIWRNRLGLDKRFTAVYFGAMGLANGLEYVIESARILAQRRNDHIALVLVGDGGKRPELEKMAQEFQLKNMIFSDPVSKVELARLVAGCDVCVTVFRAAKEDNWSPNKMFDALAAGKAVLINVPGWLREIVENNKAGCYVDPYRPQALADALEQLAANPELCREMGKNARALAEREFDRKKLADKLEKVLLQAAKTQACPEHSRGDSSLPRAQPRGPKHAPSAVEGTQVTSNQLPVTNYLPFVSIIMPIRNEANFIERAITSILNQDWPAEKMEILVVDGMSNDGTREIVKKLTAIDSRIKMLDNSYRIVPAAMNIGLKAACGDLFIRVDGHAEVAPDFVMESVKCLHEHPQAWVVGGYIETVADSYVGRVISSAMQSPIGVGNSRFRLGDYEGFVDTLAFGAHHKWIVDRVGCFDEELVRNQDDEFNMRVILAGGKIWMSKSIKSKYFSRGSLCKLYRQYFQYGFWRIRTLQKHKRPAAFRQVVPILFVLSLLLLCLAGLLWRPFWVLLGAEAALYGLALLAGALNVGRRAGWQYAPLSPLVFIILHFGYGLGSLWGVIRFLILKGYITKKPEEIKMSR